MTGAIPVQSRAVSVIVLRGTGKASKVLLLKRTGTLDGTWCQVAGKVEAGETGWQAALRELQEETSLAPDAFYSADICEQFYEADHNCISLLPVFVALVGETAEVRLNHEHSESRWVDFATAEALVSFPGQRHVLRQIRAEFVERQPNPLLQIKIDPQTPT